jgi:cytochrome P450
VVTAPNNVEIQIGSSIKYFIMQLVVKNLDSWNVTKKHYDNFRYGEIFKTNILGCPCVMLASPEAARFVLVTQSHLFKPTYPKSKERLIGPSALFFHQGEYHLRLRKLIQKSLSLDSLRNLVPHIEALAISTIKSWGHDGCIINTFKEMKKVCYIIFRILYVVFSSSWF